MSESYIGPVDQLILNAATTTMEGFRNILRVNIRTEPGWSCPCHCMRTTTAEDYLFYGIMTLPIAIMLVELLGGQFKNKGSQKPSGGSGAGGNQEGDEDKNPDDINQDEENPDDENPVEEKPDEVKPDEVMPDEGNADDTEYDPDKALEPSEKGSQGD